MGSREPEICRRARPDFAGEISFTEGGGLLHDRNGIMILRKWIFARTFVALTKCMIKENASRIFTLRLKMMVERECKSGENFWKLFRQQILRIIFIVYSASERTWNEAVSFFWRLHKLLFWEMQNPSRIRSLRNYRRHSWAVKLCMKWKSKTTPRRFFDERVILRTDKNL